MKRILAYTLVSIMLLSDFTAEASTVWNPFRKKKEDKTEAEAPERKKTPYEKFTGKKGLVKKEGFIKIYKDEKDIWLEIPDSLVGREMVISTFSTSSTSPVMKNWSELSKMKVYRIAVTDSMLLFQKPQEPLSDAIEATLMSFPIKYRGADSTSYVVKANKVFDLSDENNISYKGKSYGDGMSSIAASEFKSGMSTTGRLLAGRDYVGIEREATFALTISILGFESTEKPNFTADIVCLLTLLPEKDMPHKETDSRIGTRKTAFSTYGDETGKKVKYWVNRWDLRGDRQITVYVDTLISPSLRKAIAEGMENWNETFAGAGLGNKICVKDMTGDTDGYDPLVSTVRLSGGKGSTVSANLLTGTDGEILAVHFTIPGNFVTGARRSGMVSIADVDPRFARWDIPEDALADVLRTEFTGIMGQCLGMEANYAGSWAYSPAQLRDPEFTRTHGISASVTDKITFNYMARPGDRERGVRLFADKVGEYDRYAIAWMYADGRPDTEPEHLFVEAVTPFVDYRGLPGDLGNDPFEAVKAGQAHVRYAADHLTEWLADADMRDESKQLYLDYLWIGYTDYLKILSRMIGGLKISEMRDGIESRRFEPLSKEFQKKAVKTLFDGYADLAFIDGNKELLTLSGANQDVSSYTTAYSFQLANIYGKLSNIAYAHDVAGADYTPEEFISDMKQCVMKNVSKGKLARFEEIPVGMFIQFLTANCPVTRENYDRAVKKNAGAFAELRMNMRGVLSAYASEYDNMCYRALQDVEKSLKAGISRAADKGTRDRLEYLLFTAQAALEPLIQNTNK